MTHEKCPYCNQMPAQSFHYTRGVHAGEKILEQCAGDEKKRQNWLKFLTAYRVVSCVVTEDISDFMKGTYETVDASKPEKK